MSDTGFGNVFGAALAVSDTGFCVDTAVSDIGSCVRHRALCLTQAPVSTQLTVSDTGVCFGTAFTVSDTGKPIFFENRLFGIFCGSLVK